MPIRRNEPAGNAPSAAGRNGPAPAAPTSPATPPTPLSGVQKAGIVMLQIGEDCATEVFKHLNNAEISKLGAAMAGLQNVTQQDVETTMQEFRNDADQFLAINVGSGDFVRNVLTKVLGSERAASILEDIIEPKDRGNGIDALNQIEPQMVAELIGNEHPQIIATILVHLQRDHAAEILNFLPARLRADIVARVATFGGVQPQALSELTDTLNGMLMGHGAKRSKLGGVRAAAEILNNMSTNEGENILTGVKEQDDNLAGKIQEEMFVFDNLADVDDRSIQLLIKEIDSHSLAIALKGADAALRDKFCRNMATRAAEILRDDIDTMGLVRVSKVEEEQKKITSKAREMAEKGQIVIVSGKEADSYV